MYDGNACCACCARSYNCSTKIEVDALVLWIDWSMYILTLAEQSWEYDQSFFIVWGSLLGTRNFTIEARSHRYEIQESLSYMGYAGTFVLNTPHHVTSARKSLIQNQVERRPETMTDPVTE